MAKAISSASDFLAAIAGKTKLFEIEGATVELRSLEQLEVELLLAEYGDKPAAMQLQVAKLGIANPKLDDAQLEQMNKALPGAIAQIGDAVMALSGLDRKRGDSPLDGSGLPNS